MLKFELTIISIGYFFFQLRLLSSCFEDDEVGDANDDNNDADVDTTSDV